MIEYDANKHAMTLFRKNYPDFNKPNSLVFLDDKNKSTTNKLATNTLRLK